MPGPNSPAARQFDYSAHPEWGNRLLDAFMGLPGWGKSAIVAFVKTLMKLRGDDLSMQAVLFQHYVGGSGETFDLNSFSPIPERWQVWIENVTHGEIGIHAGINGESAQSAGLDDLSDSLGHFTVVVTQNPASGLKTYDIRKEGKERYQFGLNAHDPQRRHRHGFRIHLDDNDISKIRSHFMPTRVYDYGRAKFDEQFRIVKEVHQRKVKWVVYVPWQVLASAGTPFNVHGRFER